MTNQYSPKTFLRQTPNELLRDCFTSKGALSDIPWTELPEHNIQVVYNKWQALPESQRGSIEC